MPRQAREKSASGIYHIMMRSINRQIIFEDVIADRLGHSKKSCPEKELAKLSMTLKYDHVTDETRMTAVDAITKAIAKKRAY